MMVSQVTGQSLCEAFILCAIFTSLEHYNVKVHYFISVVCALSF